MTVTPAEPELALALTQLKAQYPHLGIGKVHARLLETHPNWLVSEKRTRRILQQEGLTLTSAPVIPGVDVGETEIIQHPRSKLIENLDVRQWTPKVRVKYFNKKKGKGLVATADIEAGETIWKEDPWVISPEWCVNLFYVLSAHFMLLNQGYTGSYSGVYSLCPLHDAIEPRFSTTHQLPFGPLAIVLYRLQLQVLQSPLLSQVGQNTSFVMPLPKSCCDSVAQACQGQPVDGSPCTVSSDSEASALQPTWASRMEYGLGRNFGHG